MKKRKKFLIVFLVFGIISIGSLSWYAARYSMDPVAGFEVNSDFEPHVLIATQGSAFKDGIVSRLVDTLRTKQTHVKVIDVDLLPGISEKKWDAIIILHTWEYSRPPASVGDFLAGKTKRNKLFVVTTSGSGVQMEGVDGVSSASKPSEQEDVVRSIVRWLDGKLK